MLWGIIFIPASASALDLHFPGSTYGEFRFPNSPAQEENNNMVLEGSLEQGIDWNRFGGGRWTLNTFGEFRYSVDRVGLDYNNRLIPGIGIKLKARISTGIVQIGVKEVNEIRFRSDRSDHIALGFVNYWFGWDLGGK